MIVTGAGNFMDFYIDDDEFFRPRMRSPDQDKRVHFKYAKPLLSKPARRGQNFRTEVPKDAPMFIFKTGYTERRGAGADSRQAHRNVLRRQATYHGMDGKDGPSHSFDKDGEVKSVWERVEPWEDDRRYFRASLNPYDHDKIKDWPQFVADFMETMQHGTDRMFGKDLHWKCDGLLNDKDYRNKQRIDWVGSIHQSTGRTHAHVLWRGKLGNGDLYIVPKAISHIWAMGRGVASMEHHVGLSFEREAELASKLEAAVKADMRHELRAMKSGLEMEP